MLGEWHDVGRGDGVAQGDLAFAQEFVAGSRDGWGLALGSATRGESFVDDARALGVVTADVHETLSRVLPVETTDVDAVARSWSDRLALASAAVTALDVWGDRIRAVYERALAADWPPAQRIHGDLHLGQALHSVERGWVLVDFEGEPLRPMEERDRPDSLVRDIAGMLRSFAYAQGATAEAPATWADDASAAFLEGYRARSALDLDAIAPLLDAFELDKAVYEALYEARNRPAWLPIPVRGIERVLNRVGASA
jgi:predicted trehalose synthase